MTWRARCAQAAALVGCDHKTVAHWVAAARGGGRCAAGGAGAAGDGGGPFAAKIEELVDRSHGQIRADEAHGEAGRAGLSGLGADDPAVGRGGQAPLASEAWAADAAVDPGAGVVDAVGLWRRAGGRRCARRCCSARGWRGRAIRVVVPLRDKTLPSVVMGLDRALRRFGGVPDLRADRQREDGVGRSRVRDRGPQPADRRGRPPLRADDRDVRAGGSAEQGRLGGDGQDREGRSGADRSQPPRRSTRTSPSSRRACEEFMAEVNTRAHRVTRRAAGRCGWPRSTSGCTGCPAAAHGVLRGDAQGQLAVADLGRRRAVLGPARADRRARVGAQPTAQQLIVVHVDGPGGPREVARHQLTTPGPPGDQRRALSAPAGRRARAQARAPDRARSGRSSRSVTAPRLADQGRRGGRAAGAAQDGRGGRPRQAPRHRGRSSGRCETCADAGRFADGDLAAILAHQQRPAS